MMLHVRRLRGRLAISFGKKEHRFNKEFGLALLIAALLHLVGFSLFKITTVGQEQHLALSPIHVEVDMGITKLDPSLSYFPVQRSELPNLPTPLLPAPSQESAYHIKWQEPDFSSIETIDYETLYIDFDEDDD